MVTKSKSASYRWSTPEAYCTVRTSRPAGPCFRGKLSFSKGPGTASSRVPDLSMPPAFNAMASVLRQYGSHLNTLVPRFTTQTDDLVEDFVCKVKYFANGRLLVLPRANLYNRCVLANMLQSPLSRGTRSRLYFQPSARSCSPSLLPAFARLSTRDCGAGWPTPGWTSEWPRRPLTSICLPLHFVCCCHTPLEPTCRLATPSHMRYLCCDLCACIAPLHVAQKSL